VRVSVLIVDDFYDDADVVRRNAVGFDFPQPDEEKNYPGRNSTQNFLPDGLDDIVSQLVHEPVIGHPTPDHGRFRISLQGDDRDRRYYVHVDGHVHWSGILFLSPDEFCQGGTEFFRHRETGSDRTFIYDREAQERGWDSCAQFTDETLNRDSSDLSKWEHLMTVPMRFNRLVLFRPWFWHTSGASFGDTLENGRLVQLFFFKSAPTS